MAQPALGVSPRWPFQQALLTTCLRHKQLSCVMWNAVLSPNRCVGIRSIESGALSALVTSGTTKDLQNNFEFCLLEHCEGTILQICHLCFPTMFFCGINHTCSIGTKQTLAELGVGCLLVSSVLM